MKLRIREFEESDRTALRELYVLSRQAAFPWLHPDALQPGDFDTDTRQERIFVAPSAWGGV